LSVKKWGITFDFVYHKFSLMKTFFVAVGIASVIAVTIVVYVASKNKFEGRLIKVSEAGYETAHDILFPLKSQKLKKHF
jgi:hypothetical protein